ncbi:unnamed protein product [Calypogeia fissa]
MDSSKNESGQLVDSSQKASNAEEKVENDEREQSKEARRVEAFMAMENATLRDLTRERLVNAMAENQGTIYVPWSRQCTPFQHALRLWHQPQLVEDIFVV